MTKSINFNSDLQMTSLGNVLDVEICKSVTSSFMTAK